MERRLEKTAHEIEQEAVMLLAYNRGLMSFKDFEEVLRENLGLLNPQIQRGHLIQKGLIEELVGKDYIRLPFKAPQPQAQP